MSKIKKPKQPKTPKVINEVKLKGEEKKLAKQKEKQKKATEKRLRKKLGTCAVLLTLLCSILDIISAKQNEQRKQGKGDENE